MTREEFIAGLAGLGAVERRPQPGGQILAVLEAQGVPGTGQQSRVAFLLPEQIASRPQIFVDAGLRTRNRGVPNNWTTMAFSTDVLATWSFNCPWDPASDSPEALALAVLAQWDR
jgi:hypothetical protein